MPQKLKHHTLTGLMVLPLFLYLLAFAAVPLFSCVVLSLTDGASNAFPSLDNYRVLFRDDQFGQAFQNTLWLTSLGVSLEVLLGLAVALVLQRLVWGRAFVRAVVLTPLGLPTVVAGVMFIYLFSSTGYVNEFLYRLGLISAPIDWVYGGWRSLGVLLMAELWKVTPVVAFILLAGLESIPETVYEAAAVDGAGAWRQFWHVTLPLLRPSLMMAVVVRAIDAFRVFELPLILTGKSFPVLGTLAYSEYYEYDNPFTSAAAATVLLAIIAACIGGYLFLMTRRPMEGA